MDQNTAAQKALRELAGPRLAGDPLKALIHQLSRQVGLSYSRTYELWYGRVPRVHQYEMNQIADALEKKRKTVARNELAELRAQLSRLETMLLRTDPDFNCPTIDALRDIRRQTG